MTGKGEDPGEVGRAPDGTASPTSSEGGRRKSVASPQGSPQAIFGDRTLVSQEGVSLTCSVTPGVPVEANRLSTVAPGQSHPLSWRSVRLLLRATFRVRPCAAQGWWGTLVDSSFTLKCDTACNYLYILHLKPGPFAS